MAEQELELASVGLQSWGRGQRYRADFTDGSKRWLARATSVLGVLNKDALEYFFLNEAVAYLQRNLESDVPYGEDELEILLSNAKKEHRAISKASRELGTEVHSAIEEFWKGNGMPSDRKLRMAGPQFRNCMKLFGEWQEDCGLKPMFIEKVVWDLDLGVAGTLDLIAEDRDGKVCIVDYKTSKGLYLSNGIQQGGYASMVKNAYGVDVDYCLLLRLGKNDLVYDCMRLDGELLMDLQQIFETLAMIYNLIKKGERVFEKHREKFKTDLLLSLGLG